MYAKQIAKNIENDEKIIIAENQTEGIGTKGRKWYTGAEKNILKSLSKLLIFSKKQVIIFIR